MRQNIKVFRRETVKVFFFLGLLPLFCQTALGQKGNCIEGMFFDDILSKFTTRRTTSPEPINKELAAEIPKRKIGFELNEAKEKTLRDAGANDSIIKLIRENALQEAVEARALYYKYLDNYESKDVEELKTALESAKEFVNKFENKSCYEEHVSYYKNAIEVLSPYIQFLSNYRSNDVENLKAALEAAKEYVRKFEKDNSNAEEIKYFKAAIPKLIYIINSRSQRNP